MTWLGIRTPGLQCTSRCAQFWYWHSILKEVIGLDTTKKFRFWDIFLETTSIKGLYEATTIFYDEVHASVKAENDENILATKKFRFWDIFLETTSIKGLYEATTIFYDEVHASVKAEKMKIFWLCCKNKFLSSLPYLNLLKSRFNHCHNSAIQ